MFLKANRKAIDILLLIVFPVAATVISVLFTTNFFVSILLFLALPVAWLSIRTQWSVVWKMIKIALIVSIPAIIIFDYLAVVNNVWFIPHSIFSFRLFDVIAIEQFFFAFFVFAFVFLFYEYMLDNEMTAPLKKRAWYFTVVLWTLTIFFVFLIVNTPQVLILTIPFPYLTIPFFVFLIPLFIFMLLFKNRLHLINKLLLATVYFFFVLTLFEFTALHIGQWEFPAGDFIGTVTLLRYTFPLEELIFWLVLFAPISLAYYEFFADDRK